MASISIINTTIKNVSEYKTETKVIQKYRDSMQALINEKQKLVSDSLNAMRVAENKERDSLILLAKSDDMPFPFDNNTSTDWIKSSVSYQEKKLNSGDNNLLWQKDNESVLSILQIN